VIGVSKEQLRKIIREEISALPEEYIAASNQGIFKNVMTLDEFISARSIFIYYSIEKEPATLELAQQALEMGKTVAFPLCYRDGIMDARIVNNFTDFSTSVSIIGIPSPPITAPIIQPEELDLILVPALAFDSRGFRLGLGGGYYDRYLSNLPAYTVGLARGRILKDEIPSEPHDVPVKCIVSEEQILTIKS